GVTQRTARAFGYFGDMRTMPEATARNIALNGYWQPLRLDEIAQYSQRLATELFDINFNMWSPAAGTWLQRALNALNREQKDYADVKVDGQVGVQTILALKAYAARRPGGEGQQVLLTLVLSQRVADYLRQATARQQSEEFLYGWVLRRGILPP